MSRFGLFFIFAFGLHAQRVITTIAGTDSFFSADGKPATQAPLGNVSGIALDSDGNILATDPNNGILVRIDNKGVLNVVAGNGIAGYSGDGGPATSASLSLYPLAVASDSLGNSYISDFFRVRKITPDGVISTIAGGGQNDPGDGGPATQAKFSALIGIAVDSNGNVLLADTGASRIRRIGTNGIITTIAGTGQAGFSGDGQPATMAMLNGPQGVSVDPQGNILISDTGNNLVRRITPDGLIATVAGNGQVLRALDTPVKQVRLVSPQAAIGDAAGNLYIYETFAGLLLKVSSSGRATLLTNFNYGAFGGDGGPATDASVSGYPYNSNGLALDKAGNLYLADGDHGRIRKIDTNGIIGTVAGNGLFQFGGDGGPAASALLRFPAGLSLGPSGEIFFTDTANHRVRAVSPDGTIQTVAGNSFNLSRPSSDEGQPATDFGLNSAYQVAADGVGGVYIADSPRIIRVGPDGKVVHIANDSYTSGFSGDGGPARAARLGKMYGLALDPAGNLYVSEYDNHRIRKITPGGTISTIAGSGPTGTDNGGFSGDEGPATQATLNNPGAVTLDSAGNLYVVDYGNDRVRKITPDGVIHTIAGTGAQGYSGDGGPATQASLSLAFLSGIAVANDGTVYFSDSNLVRGIAPDGTISTFAGTGRAAFSGDGGPPERASLNLVIGLALDAANNLYIADNGNNRLRVVYSAPPVFSDLPPQLTFSALSGGGPTAAQEFTVSTSVPGMAFTAGVTTGDGGDWLKTNVDTGASPRLIQVTVDPFKLPPGTYSGTIAVQVPSANPSSRSIPVSLSVQPGVPPALKLDKQNLSFTFPSGASKRSQSITVYNTGGGSLDFSTSAATASGGNWLSISPASGSAIPNGPVVLAVTADPTGLAPGTYNGKVTIFGTDIPITMTISTNSQAILLSQTGLSFSAVAQGSTVPPQSFGVLNIGQGVMNWTVSTSTLAGSNWLKVSSSQGFTDASAAMVPLVSVSVDPTGLDPGGYYGVVRVAAPSAANRSQVITVFLEVMTSDQDPGPRVEPSELVFTAVAGGVPPGSKDLQVYNIAASTKSYHAISTTQTGTRLYQDLPTDATLTLDRPTRLVVQPLVDGLAPGVYSGNLALQFTDGRAKNVPLRVIVSPAAPGGASGADLDASQASCTPTKLIPALPTLGDSFSVSAGWPVALVAEVRDDCGNTMTAGTVRVSFSNGDQQLSMQSLKNGQWQQTWQTGRTAGSQLTVSVDASSADQQLKGTRVITGGLRSLQDPPVVDASKIGSSANLTPFVPLAPGALITISGDRLSQGQDQTTVTPLPQQLAGATVILGGRVLPLTLATPNQLNAMVPFDIETNTRHQLLVQRGSTLSQPVSLDVADSQPAIFTTPATPNVASNQGVVYVIRGGGDPFLAIPSSPAQAGDGLAVYCAGLGVVNVSVNAGDASPNPAAATVSTVRMNIGGTDVAVDSATLIPGMVGIYQVKSTVPAGLPTGGAVPVMIQVAGQTSPAVTMALR